MMMTTTTMMTRTKIAIDVDEVLAQFLPQCNQWYNAKFRTQFRPEDYTTYNFRDTWRCSQAEAMERVFEFLDSPDFDDTPPVLGAQAGLQRLARSFDLAIVTSRQLFLEQKTRAWLQRYFPTIQFSDILFGNQWLRPGNTSKKFTKRELCLQCGAQALVDDLPLYILETAPVVRRAILFDNRGRQQWSKIDTSQTPPNVRICHTWDDICDLLETAFLSAPSGDMAAHTETETESAPSAVVEPVRT